MLLAGSKSSLFKPVRGRRADALAYVRTPVVANDCKRYSCWARRCMVTASTSPTRAVAGGGLDVAIIGAGFSGLGMAIQLKQAGLTSFTIFEAADDIGGTWRDNSYPGCACDIPSPLYSYSFAQYPYWSELYSGQQEIWRYQKWVVGRYALQPHIKLSTRIVAASFDEAAGVWHLTSSAGDKFNAHAVVTGVGGLSTPSIPNIPRISSYTGITFHSAAWNHIFDLAGKRVAVIGTGASAIQIIPAIQPQVSRLFVFQRTPAWIVPRMVKQYSKAQQQKWWWPWRLRLVRLVLFLWSELVLGRAMISNSKVVDKFEKVALDHLKQQVADEALRGALTPHYRIGCKRVLSSNNYYPAMSQPNVQLITSGLAEIKDGKTLVATDGTQAEDVDAIIFSTGFNLTGAMTAVDVRGLAGQSLADTWLTKGPKSYYGLAAAGFPNMFFLMGPNTGLGHNSVIYMIECQVAYVVKCLKWMQGAGLKWLEVKGEAQESWYQGVQKKLKSSVWLSGGCKSWYLDGKGGSFALWSGLCLDYWWQTRKVKKGDWNAVKAGAGKDKGV